MTQVQQKMRRWVITTTLNDNLLRAKIPPLLAALPDLELIIVTDQEGPPIERVRYAVPEERSVRLFGRLIPRWFMLWREIARVRVERVMVYNAVPHLLLAFLPACLLGRKLDLHMIAGQVDLDFVSTAKWSDNRVIAGMKSERKLQRLMRLTRWIAFRHCDRIFVPGKRTRDWLIRRGVAPDRIHEIHSAIDTARFAPGLEQRDIDVLIVANYKPVKQPHLTMQVLEAVHRQRPSSRFVWIGDGPLRDEVHKLLAVSPVREVCELVGHTEDIAAYARRAKLYLINSVSEGLSCATMEAMACGAVPISSDVGDMPEVVRNLETGALLSANAGPTDYTRKILDFLEQDAERARSAQASRDLIEAEHSYKAIIAAWREIEAD